MVARSGDSAQLSADAVEQRILEAMATDDWSTVDELELVIDGLQSPTRAPDLLSAALWYARHGLHIFPLRPGAKIPYAGSHGFEDATTDADQIWHWWDRQPDSNIGIATGHLVDVIDIDGPLGVISWARARNIPDGIGTVSTPRDGGTHIYIPATGRGNRAAIAAGIDYRGLGGYVVAPPSVNAQGVRYTWRRLLQTTLLPERG